MAKKGASRAERIGPELHRMGRSSMLATLSIAGCAVALLAACAQPSDAAGNNSASVAPQAPEAAVACPDDGPRLPVTGLCASRSLAYLNMAGGQTDDVPDGCEWAVEETPIDQQVLLYRALKCEGKETRLVYKPGKPLGELVYESAGYGDTEGAMKGQVLVRIAPADAKDVFGSVLKVVLPAVEDPATAAKCHVRKAGIDVWPDDALVVDDLTPTEAEAVAGDGPRTACGPLGLDEDSAAYWRVFQGHGWFFALGQDVAQIDPGSFTLLARDSDGQWSQAQ